MSWPALEMGLLVASGVLVAIALVCLGVAWPRSVRSHRPRAIPEEPSSGEEARLTPPEGVVPAAPERAAAPAVEVPAPAPPPPAPVRKPDIRAGLRRSRMALVGRLEGLLRGKSRLDDSVLEEIEEILFGADLGVRTAETLLDAARGAGSPEQVRSILEARSLEILRALPSAERPMTSRPHVVLIVGVNGSGKTTSIGKLASRWTREGKRVVVAAGDTYRAAAIEQLDIWAERSGAEIVRGAAGGDPAAVAYDALHAAMARGLDVVIVDTAGRLQTDQGLMDELAKMSRVLQKVIPDAPHEVLLVLDANTGQNAIRQAQEFSRAVPVSGIVLTKLDGTSKGGVVLGIAEEVGLPVRFVGMGESLDDLYDFDPESFVPALFSPTPSED